MIELRLPAREIEQVGGGLVAGWGSAAPVMDSATDRILRLWTTPFGVYKAAVAAGDKTKVMREGGAGAVVMTFPLTETATSGNIAHVVVGEMNGTPVKVTLNAELQRETVFCLMRFSARLS